MIAFIEGVEHHVVRRLLYRLGFKPHLFSCENGEHWWRQVYGDERMQAGARYVCINCPQKTDEVNPDTIALIVESDTEARIREYRRRQQ